MIHSVRAVALTAVVWLAVVGGTVSAEAAPKGNDTRAPAAKQAQSHQTDKKQDQPRTQQSDKKQDGAKSAQSDNYKKADDNKSKSYDDKKSDGDRSKQYDKKQDDTKSGSYSQSKVESAKTDAGGQPKASPKYDQSAAPKNEYAAKYESASKTSKQQPTRADGARGKGGEPNTLAQLNDDKTTGKSRSNPDGGGVDKPYPAAGKDARSQGTSDFDGNNGCGNDADRADDNNGHCGKPHDKPKKAETSDKKDKNQGGKSDDHDCVVIDGKKSTHDDWHSGKNDHPKYDDKNDYKPVPTPTPPPDSSTSSVPTPVPTATPVAVKPVTATNQSPSAVVASVEAIPQGGIGSGNQATPPSTFSGPGALLN